MPLAKQKEKDNAERIAETWRKNPAKQSLSLKIATKFHVPHVCQDIVLAYSVTFNQNHLK